MSNYKLRGMQDVEFITGLAGTLPQKYLVNEMCVCSVCEGVIFHVHVQMRVLNVDFHI